MVHGGWVRPRRASLNRDEGGRDEQAVQIQGRVEDGQVRRVGDEPREGLRSDPSGIPCNAQSSELEEDGISR